MTKDLKLYMILLGCKPKGRNTEQHDIYFGLAHSLNELIPSMYEFWPEANMELHIDAWREVSTVDGFTIKVSPREEIYHQLDQTKNNLYFINLGGYKKDEFEEFHYKILIVSESLDAAKRKAKENVFFKHTGFKGATAHIDDKYGIDIDELYQVEEVLSKSFKDKYIIQIVPTTNSETDKIHLGYLPVENIGNS